ncbi:MAG: folylpolyglutamate synthase/dihydrofolate synthase family protein, partial [Sedimentibacter sp.]
IHDILVCSGYKTGLFISPHLEEFNERIQVNKVPIDKDSLIRITQLVKEKIDIMHEEGYDDLTEFEIITAIGFKYFEEQKIDILVLEVGMGGRFDASNVVQNTLVSIIGSISLDHTEYLGKTVGEIAFEKAGIIKENSNVVIYPQEEEIVRVIKAEANKKNAAIFMTDMKNIRKIKSDLTGQTFAYLNVDVFNLHEIKINFLGNYQLCNVLTVIKTLEIIKNLGYNITEKNIIDGLFNCHFPGRFEILINNPIIILDGGHNINGIEYFSKTINENFGERKIILFYGMLKDKNPEQVLGYLIPMSKKVYTITPNSSRAVNSIEMAKLIHKHFAQEVIPLNEIVDVVDIIKEIDKDEIVAFVGSLYMIGEVRTLLKKHFK